MPPPNGSGSFPRLEAESSAAGGSRRRHPRPDGEYQHRASPSGTSALPPVFIGRSDSGHGATRKRTLSATKATNPTSRLGRARPRQWEAPAGSGRPVHTLQPPDCGGRPCRQDQHGSRPKRSPAYGEGEAKAPAGGCTGGAGDGAPWSECGQTTSTPGRSSCFAGSPRVAWRLGWRPAPKARGRVPLRPPADGAGSDGTSVCWSQSGRVPNVTGRARWRTASR